MFKNFAVLLLGLGTLGLGATAPAADAPADPRIALLKLLPAGSKLEDLRPSPVAGLYEFSQGAEVSYLTADGKFFLDGNVYDMSTRENLTEGLRTKARVAMINAVPESQMLIFSPKNPQYTITVFTDVDCGYCRKLHSEIAELNRLGVRVRYMFYPRTGPNTESWRKAEAVWCSADRNEALTRAKAGAAVDTSKVCGPTPVAREYALGQSIGVRGTPAIVTEGGDYINGYMPPHDLVEEIKELRSAKGKG
ncbi:MAG: thiol:disulfide interchange protein DsbC [Gammaproteobacteria bacterium]|nr:thiol:disulfide interchange protein DsbC [Gammaproteobacteria bacterium]